MSRQETKQRHFLELLNQLDKRLYARAIEGIDNAAEIIEQWSSDPKDCDLWQFFQGDVTDEQRLALEDYQAITALRREVRELNDYYCLANHMGCSPNMAKVFERLINDTSRIPELADKLSQILT